MTIITATYNQVDKLEKLKVALDGRNWILAIDGCKKTKDWAEKNEIRYAWHERNGRRDNEICNKAADMVEDGFLLFISGDSIPVDNYFEEMLNVAKHDRLVSGLRVNVDDNGKIASYDHRLEYFKDIPKGAYQIDRKDPWVLITSNGMLIHKDWWDVLGGFYDGYKGYGTSDHDLAMRAHYEGMELWLQPRAVLRHFDLKVKKDSEENYELFEMRRKIWATE